MKINSKTFAIVILNIIGIVSFLIYWQISSNLYSDDADEKSMLNASELNYDLKTPSGKYILESDLKEISGLSYLKNNQLACIQDEDGILYIFNTETKKTAEKIRFGKKGDYEGVEIVNDTAFILESNGKVSYFKIGNPEIKEVKIVNTHLSSENDTEGLCFYPSTNSLLITCKAKNESEKFETDDYAIYQITLNDLDFKREPAFLISKRRLRESLAEFGFDTDRQSSFKSSGLAVHPKTHHLFIISSVGKLLVVVDNDSNIVSITSLKRDLFQQPEGICFDETGNLYISSEGRSGPGYILRFDAR